MAHPNHPNRNAFDQPSFSSFLSNIPSFFSDNQTNTVNNIQNLPSESKEINGEESIEEEDVEEEQNDENEVDSYSHLNRSLSNPSQVYSNENNPQTHSRIIIESSPADPLTIIESLSSSSYSSSSNSLEENYSIKHRLSQSASFIQFNSIDKFKSSFLYKQIERCCSLAHKLNNNKTDSKYDIESDEGSEICKDILDQLEVLFNVIL